MKILELESHHFPTPKELIDQGINRNRNKETEI